MELITVVIIVAATFFTRVINLLNIPIFTDEAIYIRWAQIGLADPAHRYISLTDGKQPLMTWLMYPFLLIFQDPLFAGRFVSVISAVFAVIGIYLLGRELFGKKTAVFSAFLYIISPFTILYDRLALYDALLSSIFIWTLLLEILLVKHLRLDTALILGASIGLGLLTKSSAFFFIYLIPLSLLVFDFRKKDKMKRLVKWLGLCTISFVIAQIIYNSLRLSPWFYIINQKNYTFIYTLDELLKKSLATFLPNLHGLMQFLIGYVTIPIFALLILGLLWLFFKKNIKIVFLFLWFLIPFIALALFGRVIFPRFILFMTVPILVICAKIIVDLEDLIKKKILFIFLLFLILIYPIYQSFLIMVNPIEVSIPVNDRNQFFDAWPSGYGANEVISYIGNESKKGKVVLGTEGTFGLNPAVYEIYLGKNPNVEIHGFWPVGEVPKELLEASKRYPTYLVFKDKQNIPDNWPLKLIAKYRRGKGNTYLLFYQIDSGDKNSLK